MSKIIDFVRNDHVQTSFVSGLCIIILALAFKYLLHQKSAYLEAALPGLVFCGYEAAKAKAKSRMWTRPLLWNTAMLLVTGLVILRWVL